MLEPYQLIAEHALTSIASSNAVASLPQVSQSKGLLDNLKQFGVKISYEQLLLVIWAGIILSTVALLLLFVRLYRVIQLHQVHLNDVVQQALDGDSLADVVLQSEEAEKISEQVLTVSRPEHSEAEYQALKENSKKRIEYIVDSIGASDWSLTAGQFDREFIETMSLALGEQESMNSTWRRNFSFAELKDIMQCARLAKETKLPETVDVTLKSGLPVVLKITLKSGQWFGTIANNERQFAQLNEIASLINQQSNIKEQAYKNTNKSYHRLAVMLVQAMLQNQNIALVSGISIQSSYRPLVRMFEWIRQQQILSQLRFSDKNRNIQDVVLVDEIHSAAFNAFSEAQMQQNKLILQCDENLAKEAKIDVRLFGRLLSGFCRLALKEQYKSQLLLAVKAIDQDAGQQQVKFTAQVTTVKPLIELPAHADMISDHTIDDNHTGIESYFFGLYGLLHGKNLATTLTEKGYEVSFEIPVATSLKAKNKSLEYSATKFHALVLCRDKQKQNILKKHLSHTMSKVTGLAKIELFAEQFDLKYLNRHKLDIVVLAEHEKENLEDIISHLDNLPKAKRPKLVVLQDSHGDSLTRNGLYSLISAPVCREKLLSECERILRSEESSNLLVSSEKLSPYKYQPSQIEILLAVKSPQQHQGLWLLLQWFGFNVKVVCHGKSMQKHWQSGRYLVLFNEFTHSPFIELVTGKTIARGVFSFSNEDVFELDEAQADIAKHWHFGSVPKVTQIKTLVKLLSPWLKHKARHDHRSSTASMIQHGLKQETEREQGSMHAKLFDSSLIDALLPAFDLERYASNQGSPQLAVYMLDDYITSIGEDLQLMEVTLAKQSYKTLGSVLKQLNLTANILSATGLIQVTQQLEQAFCNEAYDKMARLLEQAKLELSAIRAYAEAI